jgi:hypothetical protein
MVALSWPTTDEYRASFWALSLMPSKMRTVLRRGEEEEGWWW